MHVVGKIFSTGDIQIEGRLDGDLRSHAVTIGEKAVVSGEVAGDTVTVFGRSKALFAPVRFIYAPPAKSPAIFSMKRWPLKPALN